MAQTIYLNMIPTGITPRVHLSQYDVGETVNFVLAYGAVEYTVPTGATVKVQGTKPSGFGYTVNATFTGNVASITVTEDMTGEAGNVASELVVTKDGNILGSKNFIVEVEKTPHAHGIIDGNAEEVIPELTELVERVEDAASSVLDRQTVTNTLPAGSQATYSFDEDTNTQTFGIPQGEAGAGATDVTASAYSSSKTYAVGDYVIHNGYLYRCTTAITTAESFTAGHWTQAVLADDVTDLKSDLNVVERFSMDFLENGASTDSDYYKSLETFLTNGKYYAFGITATESCKGRISTYYTPNLAGKVEDVGEYGLTANTEYILYGYNPPSTVANVRLAKVTGSGIASVAWTLKVYEIKEKANKSDLDAVETELTNDIDNLKDAVMEPLSDIGRASKSFDGDDFTSHDLYFADGTPHEYASPWCSTDFVNCVGYTKLSYDAEAFYSAQYNIDVAFVSFFDADKVMIASLNSSDYTDGKVTGTTTIPTNAVYVRVVGNDTKTRSLTLESNGYIEKIDQVWNDVETGLKICCIGDSLTEGVDGETAYPPHVITENYPFFMGKYLDATMLNYGKAGTSPNTWWANLSSYGFTFDSTIDVVLIMFGTNGNLNVNTLATDVEPYDDWHDYANTGVGCYCKIIEYIMEETSNHAQIILCTAPFNHYDEDDYYQRAKKSVETTKAIAERYLLPVIDVYYESGLNDFNGDVFRPHDNLHFSAKGYHKLGTFIGSQTKAYLSRFSLDDEYDDELPIT